MATAHIEIKIRDEDGYTTVSKQDVDLPGDLPAAKYSELVTKMKDAAAEAAGVHIPAFKPF